MKFNPTDIDGAYLIEWQAFDDERGYFAETRSNEAFKALGLNNSLSECSISFNTDRGTLRGMHFQDAPHQQTKLITCIAGKIFDAIVDLRPDSATYLKTYSVELSLDNRRMLYIPAGLAHGFLTLEDKSYVQYQIAGEFAPTAARGLRWDDPILDIDWPMKPAVLSDRDRNYEDYSP